MMVVRQFYPHITGVVTQYRQLGPELKERGMDLSVQTALTELATSRHETISDIHIERVDVDAEGEKHKPSDVDRKLLAHLCQQCEADGHYPDTVLVFGLTTALMPYYIRLKRAGVRLVLGLTIFPEFHARATWLTKLRWLFETAVCMNVFDAIVVHSTTFVKLYKDYGVSPKKLHILPFPVDCQKFRPIHTAGDQKRIREALQLPIHGEIVVFVGSVIRRKGADLLLAAWLLLEQKFPQARLVFVGPYGPRETHIDETLRKEHAEFLKDFEALRAQLVNHRSVIMAGSVTNPEDYFQAADIFAFPSLLEGMGGVIPEAMACGLPSVLTRFDGFPEVEFGTEGEQFIFADFTPQSIAEAIGDLLSDPAKRHYMAQKARQQALDVFALPIIADKLAAACRP